VPEILTESGVNPEGVPFCAIRWNDEAAAQMSPEEMRQFAVTLFAVAEAAEHDAAFVAWLRDPLGMGLDLEQAVRVLAQQRHYRANLPGGTT
jgi:hypothetical protein